eukprot:5639934-Pleurochrysis_carterae.AAC.1
MQLFELECVGLGKRGGEGTDARVVDPIVAQPQRAHHREGGDGGRQEEHVARRETCPAEAEPACRCVAKRGERKHGSGIAIGWCELDHAQVTEQAAAVEQTA